MLQGSAALNTLRRTPPNDPRGRDLLWHRRHVPHESAASPPPPPPYHHHHHHTRHDTARAPIRIHTRAHGHKAHTAHSPSLSHSPALPSSPRSHPYAPIRTQTANPSTHNSPRTHTHTRARAHGHKAHTQPTSIPPSDRSPAAHSPDRRAPTPSPRPTHTRL